MTIPKDLLDSLMKDYKNPEDLIGETGLLKQLIKRDTTKAPVKAGKDRRVQIPVW